MTLIACIQRAPDWVWFRYPVTYCLRGGVNDVMQMYVCKDAFSWPGYGVHVDSMPGNNTWIKSNKQVWQDRSNIAILHRDQELSFYTVKPFIYPNGVKMKIFSIFFKSNWSWVALLSWLLTENKVRDFDMFEDIKIDWNIMTYLLDYLAILFFIKQI